MSKFTSNRNRCRTRHCKNVVGKKENNLNAQIDYMNSIYETKLTYWSKSKVAERYSSRKYSDAIFNPDDCQLHSLNYIHRCAVEAESLGAKIFEETTAIDISRRKNSYIVYTNNGHVGANTVVNAPRLAKIMSIPNYITPFCQ